MCGEPIPDEHQHVVDIESHAMMCTCRPCYLLFTDSTAHLRYRSVPDRYLSFPDFELGPGQWDELEIPVGLAFFFRSSRLDRTVAFYPGPAGATESELPLDAWDAVLARNPALSVAAPDTEALLIRGPGAGSSAGRLPSGPGGRLLRTGRAPAARLAGVRRRTRGPRAARRILRAGRPPKQAPPRGQPGPRQQPRVRAGRPAMTGLAFAVVGPPA